MHKLGTEARVKRRVQELLEVVGLNPEHYNRFRTSSPAASGSIGVPRALAVNPKLIVCDEPVSALDVSVQAQILNLLRDLSATSASYIFIAHDLNVVRHISHRVMVMYLEDNRASKVTWGVACSLDLLLCERTRGVGLAVARRRALRLRARARRVPCRPVPAVRRVRGRHSCDGKAASTAALEPVPHMLVLPVRRRQIGAVAMRVSAAAAVLVGALGLAGSITLTSEPRSSAVVRGVGVSDDTNDRLIRLAQRQAMTPLPPRNTRHAVLMPL